jgi:hypothetical protein
MTLPNARFYKPKDIKTARTILYTTIFLSFINSVISAVTTGLNNYSAVKGLFIISFTLLVLFFN